MFTPMGGATKSNSCSYGIFLWNGKNADAVVKATALTKAFELERMLLEESNVERPQMTQTLAESTIGLTKCHPIWLQNARVSTCAQQLLFKQTHHLTLGF